MSGTVKLEYLKEMQGCFSTCALCMVPPTAYRITGSRNEVCLECACEGVRMRLPGNTSDLDTMLIWNKEQFEKRGYDINYLKVLYS